MRLLLDTRVFLWMQVAPERLDGASRELVLDVNQELLLSAASSWEVAIKNALGKLPLPEPPGRYVPSRMRRSGVAGLAVEHAHALAVDELPHHHRDPFDRLLVAQARVEDLQLLTADAKLAEYDVPVILIRR